LLPGWSSPPYRSLKDDDPSTAGVAVTTGVGVGLGVGVGVVRVMTGFFVNVTFGLNGMAERVGTGVFVTVMAGVGVAVTVCVGCGSDPMVFFRYRLRKLVPLGNTKADMGAIMSSTATRTATMIHILNDFMYFPLCIASGDVYPGPRYPGMAQAPCRTGTRSEPGNQESGTRVPLDFLVHRYRTSLGETIWYICTWPPFTSFSLLP
jgi:hypothetical protein